MWFPAVVAKTSIQFKKLLFVLFAIQLQNTGHIFLLLVYIVALGKIIAPHLFLIYLFSNFPPEKSAKTFSTTRTDIRYRLIRKNVVHSCTGDVVSNY